MAFVASVLLDFGHRKQPETVCVQLSVSRLLEPEGHGQERREDDSTGCHFQEEELYIQSALF